MKKKLLPLVFTCSLISAIAQPTAFTNCPDNNIAIVRAGINTSLSNPISLYNVNTTTGSVTLLKGPILDPTNNTINLQVNGIGLNKVDGFLYGLSSGGISNLTTNNPLPFYRIGANAVALQTGNISLPALAPGETESFINPAAGEVDQSNNFYFTAATATVTVATNPPAQTVQVNRLFIGKLSSLSSLSASSSATLNPTYTLITTTDINCTDFITSLTMANAAGNSSNTGIEDLVFDNISGSLYSYVTYPDPANVNNYLGLMITIDPQTGILKAIAPPSVLSFASADNNVSGTLLDKNRNFLILFTDGSMYKANTTTTGAFDGSIAALNAATNLPSPLRGDMASCGEAVSLQPVAFTGCPGNNLAILRAGNNSNISNPVSIYNVNSTTGAVAFLSGPILDPSGTSTYLQVNGVGLNSKDGFLYGINSNSTTNLTTNTPLPFYRIGANAVAVEAGVLPGPALMGNETQSFVNPAAGEADQSDNFYFTGATAAATIDANLNPTIQVKRLFIGKLSSLSTLAASTATVLNPSYTLITTTDVNCAAYINTLTAAFTAANAANASNSEFNDLAFDNISGNLYSYVTYPDPNSSGYFGLMITVNPSTGVLKALAPPVILSFASVNNNVSGTLLDKNGNFLILFTDGTIYRANTTSPDVFDGSIAPLNLATNLPSPLRGDLASCGASLLLPVVLDYFNAYSSNNTAILKWETSSEINTQKFVVERSTDGTHWLDIQTIAAAGNASTATQYSYQDKNITAKSYFYRLQIVDADGTITYSGIKNLLFNGTNISLYCYPNPAKNEVYAESNVSFSNTIQVTINDATGKTYAVPFNKTDGNKISIDLSAFSKGMYFLQIIDEAGHSGIQKIIKQ